MTIVDDLYNVQLPADCWVFEGAIWVKFSRPADRDLLNDIYNHFHVDGTGFSVQSCKDHESLAVAQRLGFKYTFNPDCQNHAIVFPQSINPVFMAESLAMIFASHKSLIKFHLRG